MITKSSRERIWTMLPALSCGMLLIGMGCQPAASSTVDTAKELAPETQIKKIQEDPGLPPQVKENLIASIRSKAAQKTSPTPTK